MIMHHTCARNLHLLKTWTISVVHFAVYGVCHSVHGFGCPSDRDGLPYHPGKNKKAPSMICALLPYEILTLMYNPLSSGSSETIKDLAYIS